MKALIISIICLGVVILPWGLFISYSDKNMKEITHSIDRQVMPLVEEEQCNKAYFRLINIQEEWNTYKKPSYIFINEDKLNEIDAAFERATEYLKFNDLANSRSELTVLSSEIRYTYSKEKITIKNIL